MEIKVALLLVSALIAVAAAYPTKDQQQATAAAVTCNSNTLFRATINRDIFYLRGCTKNGRLCVSGLPSTKCLFPSQCYYFFWYSGSYCWSTVICQNGFAPGCCYEPGSLPHCNDVQAQEEATDDAVEGVKICETDANGDEHCRSLSEGKFAEAMQESDCFCVKDTEGHKVCEPDKCDSGRQVPKFN